MKKAILFLLACFLQINLALAQDDQDVSNATARDRKDEIVANKKLKAEQAAAKKEAEAKAQRAAAKKEAEQRAAARKAKEAEERKAREAAVRVAPKPTALPMATETQPVATPKPESKTAADFDVAPGASSIPPIPLNDAMKKKRKKLLRNGYSEFGVDVQGRTIYRKQAPYSDGTEFLDYKYIEEDGESISVSESGLRLQNQQSLRSSTGNPTAKLGPKISFDRTTNDYGTIRKGSNGERVFKVSNQGGQPLIIKNAKSSCGCVTVNYTNEPILPGYSSEIIVKYDTQRMGGFSKTVTLETNESSLLKILTIQGTVVQ